MNRVSLILLSVCCLSIYSCDMPECSNTNSVFNKFSPDAREYRDELGKQIRNIGVRNLSYWHDQYLEKNGAEYIVVHIQGKDLCAKGEIQVNDWTKLSGIRNEPSGYRGAELVGLDFEIDSDSTGTVFRFEDIDKIID